MSIQERTWTIFAVATSTEDKANRWFDIGTSPLNDPELKYRGARRITALACMWNRRNTVPGPVDYEKKRATLRARYMTDTASDESPGYTGGVDHLALICSDIEATLQFYTGVLKMRLTRVVPNRDEPTSTHIFLDMGGGNRLAFFDFPNKGEDKTVRGIGSMHHVALKATRAHYDEVLGSLVRHGITHSVHNGADHDSVYFRDPDDILLEITTGH